MNWGRGTCDFFYFIWVQVWYVRRSTTCSFFWWVWVNSRLPNGDCNCQRQVLHWFNWHHKSVFSHRMTVFGLRKPWFLFWFIFKFSSNYTCRLKGVFCFCFRFRSSRGMCTWRGEGWFWCFWIFCDFIFGQRLKVTCTYLGQYMQLPGEGLSLNCLISSSRKKVFSGTSSGILSTRLTYFCYFFWLSSFISTWSRYSLTGSYSQMFQGTLVRDE